MAIALAKKKSQSNMEMFEILSEASQENEWDEETALLVVVGFMQKIFDDCEDEKCKKGMLKEWSKYLEEV